MYNGLFVQTYNRLLLCVQLSFASKLECRTHSGGEDKLLCPFAAVFIRESQSDLGGSRDGSRIQTRYRSTLSLHFLD